MRKFLKTTKSLMLCVCVALTVSEIKAQDTMIVRVSLRVPDFRFDTLQGYDLIRSQDNRVAYTSDPGKPMLPVFVPTYIIPFWKTVSYCEVVSKDSVLVPGFWRIYPAQSSSDTSWVPPDSAVYYSDSLYPGIPTGKTDIGSFDGAVLARPEANVFQYRPLSGKLFLYTDITLKLVFKDSDPPINAKERYAHVQAIYDDMLRELVENDEAIGAWYRRPMIIEPGSKTMPDVFAIITTANQMDEAAQYADWTIKRGYPTIVVDVATITSSYPGRNPAERVFNWIQERYQLGLSFVLFLGHETEVPYRYLRGADTTGPPHPPTTYYKNNNWLPSDLYFASVSCPFLPPNCDAYWDCDGDHAYGETNDDAGSYDNYSEVFVGRVLALNDPNEAQRWVDKVLNYEQNPGNATNITVVNFVVDGNSPELYAAYEATCDSYPQPPFVINPLISQTAAQVRDALNNQACGWVNLYTHGKPSCFITRAYPDDPAYYFYSTYTPFSVDLTELTNQNKYFLAYSVGCLMSAFDEDSGGLEYSGVPVPIPDTNVAEGFVEAYTSKGAVAFLGNTRWEIQASSTIKHQAFLDFMLNNPLGPPNRYILGVADAYSRTAPGVGELARRQHNLFGSPLTDAYSDVPKGTRTTASPNSIVKDLPTDVLVTARYWNGSSWVYLSGATVTLYGCGVYLIGSTNANGQFLFEDAEATSTGYVYATTTKHNYKFSQATITVTEDKAGLASEAPLLPQELFMDMTSGNPARNEIKLLFGIPLKDEGFVSLKIYDVSGRAVKTVFSEEKEAGFYELSVPVTQLSAGTYFLRLETENKALTEKIIIGR